MTNTIITTGAFDNLAARHLRFLYEIAKQGRVELLLFDDAVIEKLTGQAAKFPLPERQYYLESVRYVDKVHVISDIDQLADVTGVVGAKVDSWYGLEPDDFAGYASDQGVTYQTLTDDELAGYPDDISSEPTGNKKVIVTGCFDWFHSGHVRFLEEASEYGDLYVVVGHDRNIEALKGPGHPMFKEDQRRFIVGSIKFVTQCLVSTGDGWLDAEPEIQRIKPDMYVVNEDGDKGPKSEYCQKTGIEYVILKREPKPGLTRRTSTNLRGF